MPRGRRLRPLLAAGAVLLAGCSSRYDDSSPPTGDGRGLALLLLALLVAPVVVVSGLIVRAHRRASRGGGRSLPGPLWVPVVWCFVAALAVGSWGGASVVLLVYVAAGAIETRGAELFFLDLSSIIALVGAGSLIGAVGVGSVALALRRGERWARGVAGCLAGLVIAIGLFAVIGAVQDPHQSVGPPLLLVVLGALPIPFLFWWGASDHFGGSVADPLPSAAGRPVPTSERPPASEAPSLTDRWFT